jgi:DNA (cytosine-5)-methyltransferase 3A
MNVLSLFDGISCSLVALKRCNIPVANYYASEIDKYAIQVSKANHPEVIHLGDVTKIEPIQNLDLLIGGSPCQDLSIAKKGRQGLQGQRSGLFYEYVRILKESKPKWFILENVNSMSQESKDTISNELGVQPIMINASLVSAQCRKRLFWTNIPVNGLPEDRGILLKDILETIQESTEPAGRILKLEKSTGQAHRVYSPNGKSATLSSGGAGLIKIGHIGNSNSQANRVYSPEGKSVCLSANGGGLGAKTGLYKIGRDIGRRLENGIRKDDDKTIPITRRIETREDGKCGTLTSVTKDNLVVGETIRKLTPIECERLQGLPDDYTKAISNTQRYKCLGNAFNVDVICFILCSMTHHEPCPSHAEPYTHE